MKSQQRRRQVRPLTIYGFRRGRPKSRRIWLALIVLASLSVLPRVLSPIAEKLWGESPHGKAPPSRPAVPLQATVPEPGNAFASSEPERAASESLATADSATLIVETPATVPPTSVAPIHASAHRAHGHGKKSGTAVASPRPRTGGLVPASK